MSAAPPAPCPWTPPGRVRVWGEQALAGVDDAGFLAAARAVCREPLSAALISGGDLDCARHNILAWDPLLTLASKNGLCRLTCGERVWQWPGDPLMALDQVMDALKPDWPLLVEPFSGGAMGYAAYELKNAIERLPQTAVDDLGLPDMLWIIPGQIMAHERASGAASWLRLGWEGAPPAPASPPSPVAGRAAVPPLAAGPLSSNFTHADYLAAVQRIRDYIRAGDVYQVNLSQRFSFPLAGDAFALWERLLALNPAPFYAYVNAGDHQVLSTSMERFLLRRGGLLETRPIKGTRPRGKTPDEDQAQRRDLATSPKDDAELSMIVDLLRNDLGRVCQARSIEVAEHKRVEAYQNVYHLVSIVRGQVGPELTPGRLLRAAFPGGSITGCPKIRAMEIIDELEPSVRHVYTGSMGYLGWHQNLDLNIAIRTAIAQSGRCHFSVGGGVVHDSDPEAEYQETLHKGRTLFTVIGGGRAPRLPNTGRRAGRVAPAGQIRVG